MKTKIKYSILLLLIVFIGIASCSSEDIEVPDLSNEYPRILGNWPGFDLDGNIGTYNVQKDSLLKINLQFTPTHLCVGKWYIDNVEVHQGNNFERAFSIVGVMNLKLVVTAPAGTTSREANISVFVEGGDEED